MTEDCLFCRIVKKEIPASVVFEDEAVLAFRDINPQAPVHIQIIPKRHVARACDLTKADGSLVSQLVLTANQLASGLKIVDSGYRLVVNCNAGAGQTVYHLHLHLLGGRPMGWPPG
jgi:histidine triad (HIT) family protein